MQLKPPFLAAPFRAAFDVYYYSVSGFLYRIMTAKSFYLPAVGRGKILSALFGMSFLDDPFIPLLAVFALTKVEHRAPRVVLRDKSLVAVGSARFAKYGFVLCFQYPQRSLSN